MLYIHGLGSSLQETHQILKIKFLKTLGVVIAPQLDYKSNNKVFDYLDNIVEVEKPDLIIGNSIGGFMAFNLSLKYGIKCLLFNPALAKRSVEQLIPKFEIKKAIKYIILGAKDTRVPMISTMYYLVENKYIKDCRIKSIGKLEHRVPVETFIEVINEYKNRF